MNETATIESGRGVIDISFDGHVLCLSVLKPVAVDWYDNEGTMGKYFVLNPEFDRTLVSELNDVLVSGTEASAKEKLLAFLELFVSGTYQIHSSERLLAFEDVHSEYRPADRSGFYRYAFLNHNENTNLMFTQPHSAISAQRIAFYKDLIGSGGRPAALLLSTVDSDDNAAFVLDGHHKILAYLQSGVPCRFFTITKISPDQAGRKAGLFDRYVYLLDESLKDNIVQNHPLMEGRRNRDPHQISK